MEALPAPTEAQRKKAIAALKKNPTRGTVAVLRAAGVKGSRGQLHDLVARDDELREDLELARGRNLEVVKKTLFEIATDKDHPSCQRAIAQILKAYDPAFRDVSRHELTGADGGPVSLLAGRFDPDQLTIEELEQVRGLLEKASPREIGAG